MQKIADNLLLEKLRAEDKASYQFLYTFYFPSVASYIKQNMGNQEDAEDIFHESIMILLEKVKHPDFVLTSTLKTYLVAIAKNIWLKQLRNKKRMVLNEFEHTQLESETFSVELQPLKTHEEKIVLWLTKITRNCQRVLKALFFYHESMESLMKKMGWKNKHTAANQQYKCIQQVKKVKEREEGA